MAEPLPSARANRNQIVLMSIGLAALLAVGAASLWLVGRNAGYVDRMARTLELKTEIVRLLSLAQDAETGQRGYLLTNDERYLRPYETSVGAAEPMLEAVGKLVADSPEQTSQFVRLRDALRAKLAELGETVALHREGRTADALSLVETDRGREAMLAIRRGVANMTAYEDREFAERSGDVARSGAVLVAVNVIALALIAILALVGRVLVRRNTRAIEEARSRLEAANQGLESAVVERTSELLAANEEIQRFAYIVSHDLRAPLVNVMGFTAELDAARGALDRQFALVAEKAPELVQEDAKYAVEQDLPEAIGFIRTSTAKMDRLINAILKLSREGRRIVTPQAIALDEMVQTIAETMQVQTSSVGAEIVIAPDMPRFVNDRMAIEQIFQNLIENAVKYLDKSRPGRVVVSGRRVGPQVEFTVEDNGRGIDPKDHERVFELFRRSGAQDQPGEGLGLAFVRANVRRLGGTIRLTSELGRGSAFHLTFPVVFQPQAEGRAA
jgi:signal transduction histidine kinase